MRERLEKLRLTILKRLPESQLRPLPDQEMGKILVRYPDLPEHLRQLFNVGRVGQGRYAIHGLLDPGEVYDAETARGLDGIVLVGDDYAGTCEAYDTKRGWKFGSVDSSGEFSESISRDFVEFLEKWYGDLPA